MSRKQLDKSSEQIANLGPAKTTFRASWKTLFWSYFLAVTVCVAAAAALVGLLWMLLTNWSGDVAGAILILAIVGLLLWAGRSLWRQASRIRRFHVTVHADGLIFDTGTTILVCRWDEVVAAYGRKTVHHDAVSLSVGGIIPIPGTTVNYPGHVSHHYTLWRRDGVPLVFTEEIRKVDELAGIVQDELARRAAPGQSDTAPLS
jgi:hypothetical protein